MCFIASPLCANNLEGQISSSQNLQQLWTWKDLCKMNSESLLRCWCYFQLVWGEWNQNGIVLPVKWRICRWRANYARKYCHQKIKNARRGRGDIQRRLFLQYEPLAKIFFFSKGQRCQDWIWGFMKSGDKSFNAKRDDGATSSKTFHSNIVKFL